MLAGLRDQAEANHIALKAHVENLIVSYDAAVHTKLRDIELAQETVRSEVAHYSQTAAIPLGDTPTVEELIEQAKADPLKRKLFETAINNLEFEDPLVGFN